MGNIKKKVNGYLLGFVGLMGLSSGLLAQDYDIKVSDLKSFYNVKDKKCDTLSFNMKTFIINDIRNGNLIVNEKYINDAGITYIIVGEWENGQGYEMVITSNLNQCRFYEDLIIKKMDVKANAYMNHSVKK